MSITQEEFDALLADGSKTIMGDIAWSNDVDHSPAQEFSAKVKCSSAYRLSIEGYYNPLAGKLSYAIIIRGEARIYALDLGADHRNPDGIRVGEIHKHRWCEGYRDKWAYVPKDITETWNKPIGVWHQFCIEANLSHSGKMLQPSTHED